MTKTVFDLYKDGRFVAVCDATALGVWFPRGVADRTIPGTWWGFQPSPWFVIRRFVPA